MVEKFDSENVGTVVVAEDGEPIGVVTDRDVALAVGSAKRRPGRESVRRRRSLVLFFRRLLRFLGLFLRFDLLGFRGLL